MTEQYRVRIFGLYFLVSPIVTSHLQFKEKVRRTDILCLIALLASLYFEHIGQIGLATAGNTSDEDIPVICDVRHLPLAKCLCLWHYSSVTVALIWRALKQGKLSVKGIVACLFTENVLEIKAGMLQEV